MAIRSRFGGKTLQCGEISQISVRHNLVTDLVFQRRNGPDVVVKSWMLSKPAHEVLADLKSILLRRDSSA